MNSDDPTFMDFKPLKTQLITNRHRLLMILSGSTSWQNNQLSLIGQTMPSTAEQWLALGGSPGLVLPSEMTFEKLELKQLAYRLGQETDGVILDTAQGFSANSLGISAGLIRAGGMLILLTPAVALWREQPNAENLRFLNSPFQVDDALPFFTEYLIQQWQAESEHPLLWLEEQHSTNSASALQKVLDLLQRHPVQPATLSLPTPDQLQALEVIHSVAFGHRKRPLVLSADRGRGKSSILGIAAMQCLLEGKQHIVLTASRLEQLEKAFEHAWLQLQQLLAIDLDAHYELLEKSPGLVKFKWHQQLKTLQFIAPDQLMLTPTCADLLMVDEAAFLPTPMLTTLLQTHHRMVFATTLHGYEGSGRGFELRFKKSLTQLTPLWRALHLSQPIRWAAQDPLENQINRALLLNTELPVLNQLAPADFDLAAVNITSFDLCSQMAHPEQFASTLKALFTLLVQAHYQTSPNDLQQLLSAPNLQILLASYQHSVVGVLLAVSEGNTTPQDSHLPQQTVSTTRLHGHLVPQLLQRFYGDATLNTLSTWRVMRVAVHPDLQRLGIGQKLLTHLQSLAQSQNIDYLSSSFGADAHLLAFWLRQNYQPYHLGVKRDKASGTYNVVVCQPLSTQSMADLTRVQQQFTQQLPHNLFEFFEHLAAPLLVTLLAALPPPRLNVNVNECNTNLARYLLDQRPYESVSGLLWQWTLMHARRLQACSPSQQAIWCDKVLKKQAWSKVAQTHHLAGRNGVEKQLKETLKLLLSVT